MLLVVGIQSIEVDLDLEVISLQDTACARAEIKVRLDSRDLLTNCVGHSQNQIDPGLLTCSVKYRRLVDAHAFGEEDRLFDGGEINSHDVKRIGNSQDGQDSEVSVCI